jgi:3-oxoacyl-[acyl-carrier protein] reductase
MEYIIVGGSHGITQSLVALLLKKVSTSKVHCFSRTKAELHSEDQRFLWKSLDITQEELSLDLSEVNSENLAGYVYAPGSIVLKPFGSLKLDDFKKDMQLGLWGNLQVLNKVLPLMKKSQISFPSMVFFSSVVIQKGMAFHSAVGATKGAIEGFAKNLAAELAPKIRVNVVAPSLTQTPLAAPITKNENILAKSIEKHPLKKIGTAQDIACAVEFLLDNEKSSWMTGQVLSVDGGLSTLSV